MIKLPTEFVSGDGGFTTDPLTYKLVTRNDMAAVYERSRDGHVKDYEAFLIKVDPKGKIQKFPGGTIKVVEDDTEKYPTNSQFGRIAWSFGNKEAAIRRFEKISIIPPDDEDDEPVQKIVVPVGEFTVTELATQNKVEYVTAAMFVKASVADGSVKFVREERRNLRGKMSKIYVRP
jgi:hypothetical protein